MLAVSRQLDPKKKKEIKVDEKDLVTHLSLRSPCRTPTFISISGNSREKQNEHADMIEDHTNKNVPIAANMDTPSVYHCEPAILTSDLRYGDNVRESNSRSSISVHEQVAGKWRMMY